MNSYKKDVPQWAFKQYIMGRAVNLPSVITRKEYEEASNSNYCWCMRGQLVADCNGWGINSELKK